MGQLTIARFHGDTVFGLWARIISTFFGGLMGTVIWYVCLINQIYCTLTGCLGISQPVMVTETHMVSRRLAAWYSLSCTSGGSTGQVISASPCQSHNTDGDIVHPMTNIVFFVTTALVIGYSWQDTHYPTASSPGWGIDLAWVRLMRSWVVIRDSYDTFSDVSFW
jgi:hypothetical protein